ncbi:DUF4304 domain-containing protein [Nocardia wallacei]|uniref:DUF4304 domain-containing protein n=1 Tax=Nocardia wallacei TaxID=480035 RepID=UPI002454ABBB|nr:DUF4304 domain-containing protein [Nocardia wallacei]
MEYFDCRAAYRAALRDRVRPLLRARGWRGTAPTWTFTNEVGNRAIVNFQASRYSNRWDYMFMVNLMVQPRPWIEYWNEQPGGEVGTDWGLWGSHLSGTCGLNRGHSSIDWGFRTEAESVACFDEVIERLTDEALPTLDRMLDNDHLLDHFRRTSRNGLSHPLLLAEYGPSEELTAACRVLIDTPEDADWPTPFADSLHAWIMDRVGGSPHERPA